MRLYRLLFGVVGVLAALLGAVLIVSPETYLGLYVTDYTPDMAFAAQRLGPAIVGLGALLVLLRDLPVGPLAVRIAGVAALVWLGIAATGVFHYLSGVAGGSILVAAATEVSLSILFLVAAAQARG
jgi:hypothetical protein